MIFPKITFRLGGSAFKADLHAEQRQGQALSGAKAHDVRGLAPSWAARRTYGLEHVLQACSWKFQNTFTTFYLKDLSSIAGELFALGPLSVAQTVVQPRHVR